MTGTNALRGLASAGAALLLAATLGGCRTTAALPEGGSRVDYGGPVEFGLPVTSMLGRRFETVVRQRYDFSCGSAALATLLRFHYGENQSEESIFVAMFRNGDRVQIRRVGFSLLDMKRYLAGRRIAADGYRVTIDQIAKAGLPGIALIDFNGYKHFVVVKGIENGSLLLGDPSLGLRRQSIRSFTRQWNGVFFVLNERSAIGQAHFNLAADRDRAPAGRLFAPADPLSLAQLSLTRPFINEF